MTISDSIFDVPLSEFTLPRSMHMFVLHDEIILTVTRGISMLFRAMRHHMLCPGVQAGIGSNRCGATRAMSVREERLGSALITGGVEG